MILVAQEVLLLLSQVVVLYFSNLQISSEIACLLTSRQTSMSTEYRLQTIGSDKIRWMHLDLEALFQW
ncbi:hypothetical protein RchiOBHm_Chr2g0123201 [Rosa chinensis]|uniref:Uncharacterized protein n=1 Tax=Rosa chinensis TaxID=74649 RepID=A0A2P6RT12_ROSCH|nr:hypothetical protein RchiOBHm_Chr2g0123201 [Rosa chinensis]